MSADLHAQIMNLPCKVPETVVAQVTREHFLLPQDPVVRAYRVGHRDARHAAAELATAAESLHAEKVEQLREALSTVRVCIELQRDVIERGAHLKAWEPVLKTIVDALNATKPGAAS